MAEQTPHGDPTPETTGQDWFWRGQQAPAAETGGEPTQQRPGIGGATGPDATNEPTRILSSGDATNEPTRILGSGGDAQETTRVFGTEDTRELPAVGQPTGAPAGQPGAAAGQGPAPLGTPTPQAPGFQAPGTQAPAAPAPGVDASGIPFSGAQAPGAAPAPGVATPGQQAWFPGPDGAQQPWPTGATATTGAPADRSTRRGRGLLAVLGIGALAGLTMLQGPTLVNLAGGGTSATPSATAPAGNSSQAQDEPSDQTGEETSGGQAGQSSTPTTGQDAGQPAEQQPLDPWGQSGSGSWGQGTSQPGSSSAQTTATAAQSKGVVLISTKTANGAAAGTGMVLTTNGYVLTNYHVVQSSTQVRVQVASTKKTYTATVLGHDASKDVALLKIDATGLDTVTLDKDGVTTGQSVTAVGNSEGQGYLSAATGTITDLSSSITVTDESSATGSEKLTGVIRTTAGAVPGDSGGPMYDAQGEVVGMTTAGQQVSAGPRTQSVTTASYAVPIDRALQVVDQIEKGQEQGTVRVGPNAYLGVSVQTLAGSLVVASVVNGGPADDAGLQRGDQITSLDGNRISSHAQLSGALATHNPGDRVTIGWTDQLGADHTGTVTLGSSPVN